MINWSVRSRLPAQSGRRVIASTTGADRLCGEGGQPSPAEAPISAGQRDNRPTALLLGEFLKKNREGGASASGNSEGGTAKAKKIGWGSGSRVGRRGSSAGGREAASFSPKPVPQVRLDESTRVVGVCVFQNYSQSSRPQLWVWGCGRQ